jgi:hypothetical protein
MAKCDFLVFLYIGDAMEDERNNQLSDFHLTGFGAPKFDFVEVKDEMR